METKSNGTERVAFTSDDIGIMLLESITRGLYHDPLNSVREYVQNEFDAGAKTIKVTVAGDRLTITGDGSGMSHEDLISAKRVGFSDKNPRYQVGFRGIGIWSGVAICDEVLISTKTKDDTAGRVLKIDARGLRSDIQEGTLPLTEALSGRVYMIAHQRDELRGRHGTSVELRRLLPEHLSALNRESLLSYAQQILPVRIDPKYSFAKLIEDKLSEEVSDYKVIRILVNDTDVFRPPHEATESVTPSFSLLQDSTGKPIAYVWYAISKKGALAADARYLIYKKRAFTVGDTTRSNLLVLKSTERHTFAWATGEVHVLNSELIPTAERVDFETSSAYRQLEDQVKELMTEIVRQVRKHQAGVTAKERLGYPATIKPRFLQESDPELRLGIFVEGQEFLKLLNQDVANQKLDADLRSKATKARDALRRDLQFLTRNFEAPTGVLEEPRSEPKRKRSPAKAEGPGLEEVFGQLGAYFPFDQMSLKLLTAVLSAFSRFVKGSKAKSKTFVALLKEELKSLGRQR